jgi:hypothetical protein
MPPFVLLLESKMKTYFPAIEVSWTTLPLRACE